MRFHFFPTPAEGETIYSGFCRCVERSGLPPPHIVSALTGHEHIRSLYGALPGYLNTLASRLPAGHPWTNLEHAIRLHTAMPYFTYFDSPMRRNSAVQALANTDVSQPIVASLGLTTYRGEAYARHPRF